MKAHFSFVLALVPLLGAPNAASAFAPCSTSRLQPASRLCSSSSTSYSPPDLNVAVIGAGPSGLLLSHLLLQQENIKVTLLEGRSDPRSKETEQRAYALGVGIRGRTAIRKVDEAMWQAVKEHGYESERFQLHIGGLIIPLRTEKDGSEGVEPSLLIFQSELCAALTQELELRHKSSGMLQASFDTKVESCDLKEMRILTTGNAKDLGPFDLIVGCDGVNSAARSAMQHVFPAFQTTKEPLPGNFKVVRLNQVPPKVDPTSVSLLLPKKGSTGAFVEPTGIDGSCCILFSGRGESPLLSETRNITVVVEALEAAFPQWEGVHETIAEQLMAQPAPASASSVVCNTYHYGGKAVLVGDAAHATGGVSGQGVNSALMDSVALSECVAENRDQLDQALLSYSKRQVPEGKALFDLSFGPKPKGFKAILLAFENARDTLFRGRFGVGQAPLQTLLTTSLASFAEIRRERGGFYDEAFPDDSEFLAMLTSLHIEALETSTEQRESLTEDSKYLLES